MKRKGKEKEKKRKKKETNNIRDESTKTTIHRTKRDLICLRNVPRLINSEYNLKSNVFGSTNGANGINGTGGTSGKSGTNGTSVTSGTNLTHRDESVVCLETVKLVVSVGTVDETVTPLPLDCMNGRTEV